MKNRKNSLWTLFASVKLALFVLFLLAAASILGTIIPQGNSASELMAFYDRVLAKLLTDPGNLAQILTNITISLRLDDMYHALWFESLIGLLAINLIICSIERLPAVWKMVTIDNLALSSGKIASMPYQQELSCSLDPEQAKSTIQQTLTNLGWPSKERKDRQGNMVLFGQKGPWTRLGVYIVHFSILVIIVGAMIGSHFGYKGGINIPETLDTTQIYRFKTGAPIDLGFTVRCDWFTLTRYANGAPKEYQSELVILENGQEVTRKIIEVNDPLTYKGWTFYQSSFEPHKKILVTVTNTLNGNAERFLVTPQQPIRWATEKLLFGIQEVMATDIPMTYSYRLLASDNGQQQQSLVIADNGTATFSPTTDRHYTFKVKQFYSTGLQVSKDPGVWLVYIGCMLMLTGLAIAFFMSHQRLWLRIETDRIQVTGTSNKNKVNFGKTFQKIIRHLAHQNGIKER